MSDYTQYELLFDNIKPGSDADALTKALLDTGVFDSVDIRNGCCTGYAKWYDWEGDMIDISKMFPGVLFTLYGNGDDMEDYWIAYAKDGKSYSERAEFRVIYPEFDPSKLR